MDCQGNTACQNGLRFFGTISASISHEIKNALAVISESAGLAQDLLNAAESGRPVDEMRLKKTVQRISNRVGIADEIIKNMNAFAHSIDKPVLKTDIAKTVDIVASLTRRLFDMQGMTLKVEPPADPVVITTAPFYLENMTWLLLEFAVENRGDSETLFNAIRQTGECVELRFSGIDGLDQTSCSGLPTKSMVPLLETLDARLECNIEKKEVILKLQGLTGSDC